MKAKMSADTVAMVLKLYRHGIEKEEIEKMTGVTRTSINRILRYDKAVCDDPQAAKNKSPAYGEESVVKQLFELRGLQWDEPTGQLEICEEDNTIALLHQLIGRLDVLLDICREINEAMDR